MTHAPDYPLPMDGPSPFPEVIGSPARRYIAGTQDVGHTGLARRACNELETTMRRIILTAVGAALIAVSTAQVATAAERHHARKVDRAVASEQFRNSNNSVASPTQPSWYSGGFSAPAGH